MPRIRISGAVFHVICLHNVLSVIASMAEVLIGKPELRRPNGGRRRVLEDNITRSSGKN
jgi:hypothetical protein